jgi:serine/threonine protein kinase
MCHGDIKVDNITIDSSGALHLIDFDTLNKPSPEGNQLARYKWADERSLMEVIFCSTCGSTPERDEQEGATDSNCDRVRLVADKCVKPEYRRYTEFPGLPANLYLYDVLMWD